MKKIKYNDIYFKKEYGELYELIENGKLEIFDYKSDLGHIRNIFIKREIKININGEKYYDITTPYGYGGPLIISCKESEKDKLVKDYYNKFENYCSENNIIAEFIRFHPINKNADDFRNVYDIEYVRKTVATNIKDYEDPIQNEFKKSCRREVRKAISNGVSFKIEKSPDNLDNFIELYYKTMERKDASDYYYFSDDYFKNILKNLKDYLLVTELIFQDKIISSELYFISDKLIHAHLLGSLQEYLYLSAGCLLEYATVLWGKENGYDYLHHGGGRTSEEDDSLLRNKKKYCKNTEFKFYVAKKVWDDKLYYKICNKNNANINSDFFPAYRDIDNNHI